MSFTRRTLLALAPSLIAMPARSADTLEALHGFERKTGGRIGLYAENLTVGRKLAWRADERFVMCSTFKASLAALALSRVDAGKERLDRMVSYGPSDLQPYAPIARNKANLAAGAMSIATMCQGAVELSDNTCANVLMTALGGPPALTAFWRRTGDGVSRLDAYEPGLNRTPPGDPHNTTTPQAMAGNLRRFLLGEVLSPASRKRLGDWMIACQTGTNRLRAGLPRIWLTADKTGNNGKDAAGDIAMTWITPSRPVVIAAYTRGGTPAPADFDTLFKAIGQAVGDRLAG